MNDEQTNEGSESMTTLWEIMNLATSRGYTVEFMVSNIGLHVAGGERYYKPEETSIHNFYRFEGESNPDDMSILYLMETADGTKGTLVDAYGTYADSRINDFIKQVEDIHKGEPG
jgi:hypothetical protein